MKALVLLLPLLLMCLSLTPACALAATSPAQLEAQLAALSEEYKRLGGSERALDQLKCFVKKHGAAQFYPKPLSPKSVSKELIERCTSDSTLRIENTDTIALIDYTKPSNKRRFYLFDLRAKKVRAIYVSHGRYGEGTPRWNPVVSHTPKKNSVRDAVHFSNEPNMQASAGGFYLTTNVYYGMHGRSLIMHGLEKGVNDNSCRRTTVIHKNRYITDSGVERMSSGCPMVALNRIDGVIDALKGGAALYIYTPAEAALSASTCGRDLLKR